MDHIKLVSWNVDGIRARHRNGQFLKIFNENPDIVCLQETKAPADKIPNNLKLLTGYPHFYFSNVLPGSFAGVAIYSKKKPKYFQEGFGGTDFDKEGRVLIAEYDEFTLVNIYFPLGAEPADSLSHKLAFYDAFLCYVKQLLEQKRKIIICGDFNIAHSWKDVVNSKTTPPMIGIYPEERERLNSLLQIGFFDAFRFKNPELIRYTRWPYQNNAKLLNLGWRLDYFFVSKNLEDAFLNSDMLYHPEEPNFQHQVKGSDHCPITLELNM